MSVLDNLKGMQASVLGARAKRVDAALPQTAAEAIFTVTGGKVMITGIIGEVGTIIETQANDTKLTANPTTGTSVDICATLDITADEAGTLYSITGTLADALVGTTAGAVAAQAKGVVVNAGTIDLDCAASNTGSVAWTIFYVPVDDGATIEAA
tara:strand:+ start:8130 stop:8591 length:462 start_codon:yes stop_codon:yes gene_type:complete